MGGGSGHGLRETGLGASCVRPRAATTAYQFLTHEVDVMSAPAEDLRARPESRWDWRVATQPCGPRSLDV